MATKSGVKKPNLLIPVKFFESDDDIVSYLFSLEKSLTSFSRITSQNSLRLPLSASVKSLVPKICSYSIELIKAGDFNRTTS